MSHLDRSMIFKEDFVENKAKELFKECKIKRLDDFEFTLELIVAETSLENIEPEICNKILHLCFVNFWKDENYTIKEISTQRISATIEVSTPISIDVFLLESNKKEIMIELFIYQESKNLASHILKANRTINE